MEETRNKSGYANSDFIIAIPIAILAISLFILLQKTGFVNLINSAEMTYGTAFFIGIVASLSTCMAVVGGLVLSVSANFAKGGDGVKPQIYFHIGRLVAFFILGGVIGRVGSIIKFGIVGNFILNILVAFVLIILGIKLLGIFSFIKKFQITLPNFFRSNVNSLKNINHTLTPALVGVATFFLPCGFTQSMQIYTLTTGNFLTGALTMFVFALGTLPVLALLSFGSLGFHKQERIGIFFKTAGIIVIFFGVINLISALAAYGLIRPIFNI